MITDKPIYGVQYALTGTKDTPCIMNGNTRAESKVDNTLIKVIPNTPIKVLPKRQPRWKGAKHNATESLSTKELCKLVRDEINTKYPKKSGYNISTRYESFSGGSAIEVTIKSVPFKPFTDEYQLALDTNDWDTFNSFERSQRYGAQTRYTPQLIEFIDILKHIQNQYNFDDSDSMTDYFHVNYYGNVEVRILSTNQVF